MSNKISEKIEAASKQRRNWWSFEFFPPKTVSRFAQQLKVSMALF